MRLMPLAVLWLAGACAGRAESLSQMPDGSSGAGGSLGTAGASSGRAGAGHAGSAVVIAGAPGMGAAGVGPGAAGAPPDAAGAGGATNLCDNVDCPDIVCSNGSELVVPDGACCATCKLVCKQVCASCSADSHPEMQAGACCPTCVPNKPPGPSCDVGKMQYEASRAQMVEKYSQGCSSDPECLTMTVSNACEDCRPVALVAAVAMNFSSNTSSNAMNDCGACPPLAVPPCAPPQMAVCINHVCGFLTE